MHHCLSWLFLSQEKGIPPRAVYKLCAGEWSSGDLTSGRCIHGSGTHSPGSVHSAAIPRSHQFNPIPATATHSATKAARRKSRNVDTDEETMSPQQLQHYRCPLRNYLQAEALQ
ncbi:hypothetical protein SCLCIDRAFT_1206847 [Scleroderma citrinum Foug A]|uniref:Uncharacterized protein n=1 Tax=Scleroderma citrinum Foug A TaxID=1036808 RepID=A0A0C3EDG0_9AGAM|nr:hypothetical protein SCLCIDRAFT_1206847 [Scleroderma citrinum Foug A]